VMLVGLKENQTRPRNTSLSRRSRLLKFHGYQER